MLRLLNMIVVAVLVLAAAWVYEIKYASTQQAERVAKLRIEIRQERDAIAALRAEWAALTNPDRIQRLALRYLHLRPVEALQFDKLDGLPERPPEIVPPGTDRSDRRDHRKHGGRRAEDRLRPATDGTTMTTIPTQPTPQAAPGRAVAPPAAARAPLWPQCRPCGEIARARRAGNDRLRASIFTIIAGRLVYFTVAGPHIIRKVGNGDAVATARPNILDRNGDILATDIRAPSLFGEPRKIIDADEAAELLTAVLPDLDVTELRERLSSRRGFVWLRREISPKQRADIMRLGIPGIGFLSENKRVYPNGAEVSHVIGHVNIDNQGIAGMERWLDVRGLADLHKAGFASDRAARADRACGRPPRAACAAR